jgi:hypothetical protein
VAGAAPPALALALLLLGPGVAAAQAPPATCRLPGLDVAVAPGVVGTGDGEALAADVTVAWCAQDFDTRRRFPRAFYRGVGIDGVVLFDDLRVPPNLQLSAFAGLSVSLSERAPPDPDAPLDEAESYRFDRGVLGVGGRVQYEASEDLDEQALVAGAQLRWVDANRPWFPSTVVALDVVRPTSSEVRELVGLDDDVHGRASVRGYWLLPLPGPLELEAEGAWFWTFGLDRALEERGWDSGPFLAGEVAAAVGRSLGPAVLEEVFVGYAWGQRPTAGDREEAWTVGVQLGRAGPGG